MMMRAINVKRSLGTSLAVRVTRRPENDDKTRQDRTHEDAVVVFGSQSLQR